MAEIEGSCSYVCHSVGKENNTVGHHENNMQLFCTKMEPGMELLSAVIMKCIFYATSACQLSR